MAGIELQSAKNMDVLDFPVRLGSQSLWLCTIFIVFYVLLFVRMIHNLLQLRTSFFTLLFQK